MSKGHLHSKHKNHQSHRFAVGPNIYIYSKNDKSFGKANNSITPTHAIQLNTEHFIEIILVAFIFFYKLSSTNFFIAF